MPSSSLGGIKLKLAELIATCAHREIVLDLAEHGINCAGKTTRQLKNSDYGGYDLLIGVDQANLRNMHCICGGDYADKLHLLMDFYRPSLRCSGSTVYGRFRDHLEGCAGRVSWVAGRLQRKLNHRIRGVLNVWQTEKIGSGTL